MQVASLGDMLEEVLHRSQLSENCWNKITVISMRGTGKMQDFGIQKGQHDFIYLFIHLEASLFACQVEDWKGPSWELAILWDIFKQSRKNCAVTLPHTSTAFVEA